MQFLSRKFWYANLFLKCLCLFGDVEREHFYLYIATFFTIWFVLQRFIQSIFRIFSQQIACYPYLLVKDKHIIGIFRSLWALTILVFLVWHLDLIWRLGMLRVIEQLWGCWVCFMLLSPSKGLVCPPHRKPSSDSGFIAKEGFIAGR